MKVTKAELYHALERLPAVKNHHAPYIKLPIWEPISMASKAPQVSDRSQSCEDRTLTFVKQRSQATRCGLEWVLEVG